MSAKPVLTALIGGTAAKRFESFGTTAVDTALDHLSTRFGTDVTHLFETGRFIAWGTDWWAQMGYTYRPSHATGLCAQLAQPVENLLFFAAEATHITHAASVHGVLEMAYAPQMRLWRVAPSHQGNRDPDLDVDSHRWYAQRGSSRPPTVRPIEKEAPSSSPTGVGAT